MKKIIIFLFAFLIFFAGDCSRELEHPEMTYVFEHSFGSDQELLSLRSLENIMIEMNATPIPPFTEWITFTGYQENGYMVQRLVILDADTAVYDIIYNTFYLKKPDTTYYQVRIRKLPPKKK